MRLTYQGTPGAVTIGRRQLQPGDQISEADCDLPSLERLAKRPDFDTVAEPKKPKTRKED